MVFVVVDDFGYIFVKVDKKLVKIYYQDIIYIEGLKDYVIIWQENFWVIILQIMKSLEDKLFQGIFKCIY